MNAPTPGLLKKPRGRNFMSANMVLPFYSVLQDIVGEEERDCVFQAAGLRNLPNPEEPVREKQVQQLHQIIRENYPAHLERIMTEAGIAAAKVITQYRLSVTAKQMLNRLPWSMATWMMVKSVHQNAWSFTGSGTFLMLETGMFELSQNPMMRGVHETRPQCTFHRTIFETMFREVVHEQMQCEELQCCGAGATSCRFKLSLPPQ